MTKTIPLSEAKAHLSEIISDVVKTHDVFAISRGGIPSGVIMSVQEYESLIETLEILADPELMKSIRQSAKDKKAGRLLSHEEAWRGL